MYNVVLCNTLALGVHTRVALAGAWLRATESHIIGFRAALWAKWMGMNTGKRI